MFVYAVIVSIMIAFIRYDKNKDIFRYSLKLLIYMVGGVIVFSWFMYFF